ncbi:hypothetical protein M23134_04180 [Microscilla marina ATCC 23134]|uniref:Uncharacterized protein n=1 Tax=Microscilla marina ATCC 23134 TaxID=313606 RepID=A1ZE39_MICM2|nr:hypothetical protein M23134_04180 [Microscilla marina ATCC 23134]
MVLLNFYFLVSAVFNAADSFFQHTLQGFATANEKGSW